MKRATLVLAFLAALCSNAFAQEAFMPQVPDKDALDKAQEFILNSKVVPNFNDSKEWTGPTDSGFYSKQIAYGVDNQFTETDHRSWVRSHRWQLQIVFTTRDYLNTSSSLIVRVYSFWNGTALEDVAMYYGTNIEEGRVGRTAVLMGGDWHLNSLLYDVDNPDTDIKVVDVQLDPQSLRPLSVTYTFQAVDGQKEFTLNFSNSGGSPDNQNNPSNPNHLII